MAASQSSSGQISSSVKSSSNKSSPLNATNITASGAQQQSYLTFTSSSSSAVFQQVKQTQASLARLSRVHNLQQLSSQTNQSSQQTKEASQQQQHAAANNCQTKSTTFVDCLIRRFKDCFSEDFCTVPMFVVGNLSPGSDGTHLILPPCVSLGGQNINRFAGPKNLRLINSIRESCRSIEELDLGGNKLTDLIEVYKILQCTPNLKFLNLSENDLSRTSPVAMAATCSTATTTPCSSTGASTTLASSSPAATVVHQPQQHWASSSMTLNQRTCLAPINQNQQAIGARRHSSLGQPMAAISVKTTTLPTAASSQPPNVMLMNKQNGHTRASARVTEARRLAAAAAVAQSKKTSSSVASKLANSATAGGLTHRATSSRSVAQSASSSVSSSSAPIVAGTRTADKESQNIAHKTVDSNHHRCSPAGHQQRRSSVTTSTMNLARSLSSLSAKDVRAASSLISRLSVHHLHRSSVGSRKDGVGSRNSAANERGHLQQRHARSGAIGTTANSRLSPASTKQIGQVTNVQSANKGKLGAQKSLFVEPIVESDNDVDMGTIEQQLSPRSSTTTTNQLQSASQQHQSSLANIQPRALALQTGTGTLTSSAKSSPSTGGGPLSSVSNSSLAYQQQSSPNFRRTFESVKALALNNTGCPWRVVCSILSRMPNLEELHLSLNNYERIDLDPNEFKHYSLKRLYLCNNPKLTNWEELDKLLSALPSLEALSIADCSISQIPDNLDRAREWRKLCGLNINGWPIKEWPVIERLNQLPSLIDLKCRNLEILNSIDEPRHHLIARLPKLQRLNGSEIEEREHAEKAFLRFFMANSHLERPSRFHELVQIHGEVIPVDVDVDLSPPSQAHVRIIYLNRNHYRDENGEDDILMSEDFLIKLMDNVDDPNNAVIKQNNISNNNLDSMEVMGDGGAATTSSSSSTPLIAGNISTSCQADTNETENDLGDSNNKVVRLFKDDGQEVLALNVDLRQSVRKFKSTLASLFGLNSQNLILYYIDHEMVGLMGPELIKHNQKKLWNYNVQNGDQFIVEER